MCVCVCVRACVYACVTRWGHSSTGLLLTSSFFVAYVVGCAVHNICYVFVLLVSCNGRAT